METKRTHTRTKILLVEDYPSLAHMIEEVLNLVAPSHLVTWVDEGQKAVRAIEANSDYKAIVMNYSMPVMDGIEATQRIRSLGYSGIIIGWSGYPKEEKAIDCLTAGMDFYLEKSGNLEPMIELFKALEKGTLQRTTGSSRR